MIKRRNKCKCGCGQVIMSNKVWIFGHHKRGSIPWNKNLTKENDERVKSISIKLFSNNSMKNPEVVMKMKNTILNQFKNGREVWNKNLTKFTDDRVKTYGLKATKNGSHKNIPAWNKGLILGPQPKELIDKRVLGRMGYKHKESTKRKIKETNIITWSKPEIKAKVSGENNPCWNGGNYNYSVDWIETLREAIRQRDNYYCQLCGKSQEENNRKLDVHHIDYNKFNSDPLNLISLCLFCHRKTNYHRSKWQQIFQRKMQLAA